MSNDKKSNAKKGVKFLFNDKEYYLKFNFATYADLQEAFGMSLDKYIESKGASELDALDVGAIFFALVASNTLDFSMSKREFLMYLNLEDVDYYAATLKACFEFSNKGPDPKPKPPQASVSKVSQESPLAVVEDLPKSA